MGTLVSSGVVFGFPDSVGGELGMGAIPMNVDLEPFLQDVDLEVAVRVSLIKELDLDSDFTSCRYLLGDNEPASFDGTIAEAAAFMGKEARTSCNRQGIRKGKVEYLRKKWGNSLRFLFPAHLEEDCFELYQEAFLLPRGRLVRGKF